MHQERRLPFEPDDCPETVWDQLPESQRSAVIELYARLMARAATGDGRRGHDDTSGDDTRRGGGS